MKLLFKKNYLAQIENAAKGENHLFRNFYVEDGNAVRDSLENGRNSCAVLVSSILYSFNPLLEYLGRKHWVKAIHLTVASTEKDLLERGWREIKELKPGAVIIWEKKDPEPSRQGGSYPEGQANGAGGVGGHNGKPHNHIGFFMGVQEAISNDSRGTGFPHKHHYTYNDTRKIDKIYWHKYLDELEQG